jgi:mannosyltransferase
MKRFHNRLLFAVLLLSALIRLYGLDRMALWGDEACMIYLCLENPGEIVSALASADRPDVDVAPPVYFLLLHVWMRMFGDSVFVFRVLSVVFGVLTVWVIASLGTVLFNRETGLLSAFLAAIHPFQVWYSQEGRMYSLATFFAALTILMLVRALKSPGSRLQWTGFALSGLVLLYTQYYGALLLTALVIYGFYHIANMERLRTTAFWSFVCVTIFWAIGFLPWSPILLTDYRHAGAPGGFPLMFHWLLTPAYVLLKNILFGVEMYVRDNMWLYPVPLLIGTAYLVSALKNWKNSGVKLLAMTFAIPFGVVYLLSLTGMRLYKSHPFILFHPAIIVLLAFGFTQIRPRFGRLSGVVFVIAQIYVLLTLVLGGQYQKPRVHDIADRIEEAGGNKASVAVIPAFMPNPMPIVGDLLAFRYHSGNRFDTVYLYGETADDLVKKIVEHTEGRNEFYLVYQDNDHVRPYIDEVLAALDNRWSVIDKEYFLSKNRDFSMAMIRYETHPV